MELNDMQKDALREIGNIGSGNAATALSKVLDRRIDIDVPTFRLDTMSDIPTQFGEMDREVLGIYLELGADIRGALLFLIEPSSAKYLTEIMLSGFSIEDGQFSEMENSALMEIGNMLGGAFMSSISDFTKLKIELSIPALAIDMIGAILTYPLIEFGYEGENILFIETSLYDGSKKINSDLLMIPDQESYKKILDSLGI